MVEWSKYTPNIRDGFDFGMGIIFGKLVLPRIQGYVSNEIKNIIKNSYEEKFAQERTERRELYEKIDALSSKVTELTKKVGTSA